MERFAGLTIAEILRIAQDLTQEEVLEVLRKHNGVEGWNDWRAVVQNLDPESEASEQAFDEATSSLIKKDLAPFVKKRGKFITGITRHQTNNGFTVSLLAKGRGGKEITVDFTLSDDGVIIAVHLNMQLVSRLTYGNEDSQWNIKESKRPDEDEHRVKVFFNQATGIQGRFGALIRKAYGVMGEHAQNPKTFPGAYPVEDSPDEALYGADPDSVDLVDKPMDEAIDLEKVVRKQSLTDLHLPVGEGV